jgi:hypothetical protein
MDAPMAGPLIRGASRGAAEGPLRTDKDRIRAVIRFSREARRVNSAEPSSFTAPVIRAEQEGRNITIIKSGRREGLNFFPVLVFLILIIVTLFPYPG